MWDGTLLLSLFFLLETTHALAHIGVPFHIAHFKSISSLRNKAYSPRGKFSLLNDKVVGKVTARRKKANKPIFARERAEGRFLRGKYRDRVVPLSKRRFFLEDRITPPKGRFFPLREKITDHFTSLREKSREGHVPLVKPVFPRGGLLDT